MATYKIQKGDTLSKIAAANNTTVAELVKLNNISNPNLIRTGADLQLPGLTQTETPAQDTTDTAAPAGTDMLSPPPLRE